VPRPASRTAAESSGGKDDTTEAAGSEALDGDGDGHDIIEERPLAPRAKPAPRPAPAARRSGRPSVPSWDDIMFGRKNE
jgi:hypothetical protein